MLMIHDTADIGCNSHDCYHLGIILDFRSVLISIFSPPFSFSMSNNI